MRSLDGVFDKHASQLLVLVINIVGPFDPQTGRHIRGKCVEHRQGSEYV